MNQIAKDLVAAIYKYKDSFFLSRKETAKMLHLTESDVDGLREDGVLLIDGAYYESSGYYHFSILSIAEYIANNYEAVYVKTMSLEKTLQGVRKCA